MMTRGGDMLRMTPSRMAGMPVVLAYWLLVGTSAFVIPVVPTIEVCQAPACENSSRQSHFMEGTSLLLTMEDVANTKEILPISDFKKDQVVRVLDANTLKLKQNGVVTLAGVRMPSATSSNFQFPECLSFAPAYKLRQLVPPNSDVLIKVGSTTATGKSAQAIVVVKQKQQQNNKNENALLMVNLELVRTGFGKVQKITSVDLKDYLDIDRMQHLEAHAREEGIGIFRRCDVDGGSSSSGVAAFEAQFEPLELTMETQWGDDGGKQVVREKSNGPVTPLNPGDIKGCSDFSNYEDALRWYELYFPFYGDVAKLDRDGDGVPCPGLPHTKVPEKYRMKVPSSSSSLINKR